jgi:arylsulfatase A-like enzyme
VGSRPLGVLLLSLLSIALPGVAEAVRWGRGSGGLCEPPSAFYGPAHQSGRAPCCATQPGVCPGGVACPAGGVCPSSGVRCLPAPARTRPNVVLVISDDQGDCHYGTAVECRSAQSGTPIPPPATPNLDVLAGYGTVFPIAHNTAAWCYPSLNSMLTGRYQKSMEGTRNLGESFRTIPSVLRALDGEAGTTPDPFDSSSSIGGYCTLLGGKFTAAGGKRDFDAQARLGARGLGKLPCSSAGAGQPPSCGTDRAPGTEPTSLPAMRDLLEFIDAMFYPVPGKAGAFATQPFFAWYAPRIPHAPLRAPDPIRQYLFGSGLGGLFNLAAYCSGGLCPSTVRAFDDSNVGTEREYYASVWWVDDNIRELREYLARKSAPHCILGSGASRLSAASSAQCAGGTWATEFAAPVDRNTILIYLSDNGWFLPDSKHNFTENGYRTRMFVYDPRTANPAPPWRAADAVPAEPHESPELAHATDLLPTILGYAVDTPGPQACPRSDDGTPCDGRDLRSYVRTASGAPQAQPPLRHALCGHETQQGSAPTRNRYLLTRPGSVGRCVDLTLPACTNASDCAAGEVCLGAHCAVAVESSCSSTAQCPKGALCLGGRCRVGPPCIDDDSCISAFASSSVRCADRERKWCRNAPNQTCTTADDCPVCPSVAPGAASPPCGRVCEARQLKLYLGTGRGGSELVDLFTDPDERGRRSGDDPLVTDMSSPNGTYGADVRRLSCCVDDWWPEGASGGTACTKGHACPADFVCNE